MSIFNTVKKNIWESQVTLFLVASACTELELIAKILPNQTLLKMKH